MLKSIVFALVILTSSLQLNAQPWKAKWISTMESQSTTNTWLMYRKTIKITARPATAFTRIAVDSKYWLWINGQQVVFEGGLKRGPNPTDTYYDEVNIAPYLRAGSNTIAVLLWYFGKDGFSHKSSGRAGLLFDCQAEELEVLSDKTWKAALAKAFQTAGEPYPNFRLSESSLLYDARKDPGVWQGTGYDDQWMPMAQEIGQAGDGPWNNLVRRPIPLWKDYGRGAYPDSRNFPFVSTGDTIICTLPYNAQLTPWFRVEAEAGQKIMMATDNYLFYGPETNIRAEYITKKGVQEYENPGWMNGHKMYYFIPAGVKVLDLGYRETGFQTRFDGSFSSSDPFLNKLWEKARRTLYVTMRDTYMDCPERERAAWTGDAVNESGQAFYALSPASHSLGKKWLYELVNWRKKDGTIYAPVPAGNWVSELPCQSVTSIGYYGLWNFYLHSGDRQVLTDLYDGAKQYLDLWEKDGRGTMKLRRGDWTWGDWGDQIDTVLVYNLLYSLGVKGMQLAANELGKTEDARSYAQFLETFREAFNRQFWTGTAYRSPGYKGATDDRVQALAVVSGVAGKDKYPALLKLFKKEEHASPYMEKYVFEAMFRMGYEDEAIARHKKRLSYMVNHPGFTTLFEGWGIGAEGFGGGTVNHAWTGGGLTVLSQFLCGIAPLQPGYKLFQILPQPGSVTRARASVASVAGQITSSFKQSDKTFVLTAVVPDGTRAVVGIPDKGYRRIMLGKEVIWENGRYKKNDRIQMMGDTPGHISVLVTPGKWELCASK
ncbi:alpha-L-rhamnosidase-related protein [Niabella drilacis]|uniref:alpha-L-rhamnosidase n=1 Tax=Niabella drilacis (strain DSM 25811 / CCM 8410 / CCUG 62505 / LMG 26954 / E90) TaxID=1285928 RepID=A0A1G6JIK4_NIADE|nr:alpha-L-rhamnosidase C-terminal domain-containing protein [Niabella drilacis]SDC18569.1 Glycosyl hydrolases family 2, sugar binding domain [Niabella drilacis]